MADIVLGSTPKSLAVILVKDTDFFTTLRTEDDSDWPVGTQIKLVLGSHTYNAVIDGSDASISIDSDTVNTLIAERVTKAKLMYINGSADIGWAVGEVIASG